MEKFKTWIETARVSYTAIVLSPSSRINLINHLQSQINNLKGFKLTTNTGSPLVHHVTLNLGAFDENLNDKSILGQEIPIKVVSWAEDKNVAAVGVEIPIQTINAQPHITIAISSTGKPMMSNNLTNWQPIEPITISGTVLQQ